MEDSLQKRLNDIMKPYFDKKQEIEDNNDRLLSDKVESQQKIEALKNERIEHRKSLEKQLAELRVRQEELKTRSENYIKNLEEKRDKEIDEYVRTSINSNSNFFIGYASSIRKDLENDYNRRIQEVKDNFKAQEVELKAKEDQLLQEIQVLRSRQDEEKTEISNLESLKNYPNFKNVDLRQLVEVKWSLRKDLVAYQKELNLELRQEELNFQQAMLNLSNFKYMYDEQKRVINGNDWKTLYEESNNISDRIQKLRNALKKVDEYLNLMQATQEENAAVIRSMTPIEKEEYERRKTSKAKSQEENTDKAINIPEDNDDKKVSKPEENDDLVQTPVDNIKTPDVEYIDKSTVVDSATDLLSLVFNDIINEVNNLRSVRLNASNGELSKSEYYISTKNGIDEDYDLSKSTLNLAGEETLKLPNGEYLNSADLDEALESYYEKNKGSAYIVKDTGKKYTITDRTLRKYKSKLKECSTLKLIKEQKVSNLDLITVYGKGKPEKSFSKSELGKLYGSKMTEGDYISKKESIAALTDLLSRKKLEWLKNMSEKLKQGIKNRIEGEKQTPQIELEEDDSIKQR